MQDREERAEKLRKDLMDEENYNRPTICSACGGIMVFKGVGEYKCEKCGCIGFDDYGKTRNYIEQHPGATMAEVANETGVQILPWSCLILRNLRRPPIPMACRLS